MAQTGRKGRLHPSVGSARKKFVDVLEDHLPGFCAAPTGRTRGDVPDEAGDVPLALVACSGGPDSLALASVAAHFARRGDLRVGAVIVDHALQDGSAEQAERAATECRRLGLDPVRTVRAVVRSQGMGPEMAARTARYEVLDRTAREEEARAVLLGHTLDDQAETVMLGLARGSGTRSLSGMPQARRIDEPATEDAALLIRPFLDLRRRDTLAICEAEGIEPWHDPTNEHLAFRRNLVRHEVLPFLEERMGPGITQALARTAAVLGPDAEFLEQRADEVARTAAADPADYQPVPMKEGQRPAGALSMPELRAAHPAMRRRVLARAIVASGGESPSFERLRALDELLAGHGNAGPIQMAGHVAVWRRRPLAQPGSEQHRQGRYGALVLIRSS
ncbi:tRNA lysidine(34) synthetase TilS [Rothia uropygioeca]|uniref:tRNA lysidine(34) synthetase TilS n=1 Tax=Kocuria sp. 257 TaxID=2021970 RepID=UPI0010125D3E|nr:tRNA lysidine(34) synthetase TilS [Kocuria sp. 257]